MQYPLWASEAGAHTRKGIRCPVDPPGVHDPRPEGTPTLCPPAFACMHSHAAHSRTRAPCTLGSRTEVLGSTEVGPGVVHVVSPYVGMGSTNWGQVWRQPIQMEKRQDERLWAALQNTAPTAIQEFVYELLWKTLEVADKVAKMKGVQTTCP